MRTSRLNHQPSSPWKWKAKSFNAPTYSRCGTAGFGVTRKRRSKSGLSSRNMFKISAFELSKILGKEDFGETHEAWTSFVPRWSPTGLRPGYTQKQALSWLDAQRSDFGRRQEALPLDRIP